MRWQIPTQEGDHLSRTHTKNKYVYASEHHKHLPLIIIHYDSNFFSYANQQFHTLHTLWTTISSRNIGQNCPDGGRCLTQSVKPEEPENERLNAELTLFFRKIVYLLECL